MRKPRHILRLWPIRICGIVFVCPIIFLSHISLLVYALVKLGASLLEEPRHPEAHLLPEESSRVPASVVVQFVHREEAVQYQVVHLHHLHPSVVVQSAATSASLADSATLVES
jgi:hypothetical protein